MPLNCNEPPSYQEGEGPYDARVYDCDRCGEATTNEPIMTLRQTHESPAEYERLCSVCIWPFLDYDPADREPSEDELEARRRGW